MGKQHDWGTPEITWNKQKQPKAMKTQRNRTMRWLKAGSGTKRFHTYNCKGSLAGHLNFKTISWGVCLPRARPRHASSCFPIEGGRFHTIRIVKKPKKVKRKYGIDFGCPYRKRHEFETNKDKVHMAIFGNRDEAVNNRLETLIVCGKWMKLGCRMNGTIIASVAESVCSGDRRPKRSFWFRCVPQTANYKSQN